MLLQPLVIGRNQLCCQEQQAAESLHITYLEESLIDSDSKSENSVDDYALTHL
jgi:hypothetical protein